MYYVYILLTKLNTFIFTLKDLKKIKILSHNAALNTVRDSLLFILCMTLGITDKIKFLKKFYFICIPINHHVWWMKYLFAKSEYK